MPDLQHEYKEFLTLNGINNAVISNADTPQIHRGTELFPARWKPVDGQLIDLAEDSGMRMGQNVTGPLFCVNLR
jgi:hypothetical protein